MDEKQNAFQIDLADNVATALTPLVPGPVELRGDACAPEVEAATEAAATEDSTTDVETTDEAVKAEGAEAGEAAPKKKGKKWPIVVGVVAVVLIAAGAGFWVWHEQPSFCNAICHSPMDKYVETYSEGDTGKLVTQHAAAGDTCLSCHEAEFATQVSEAMAWASDSYPMDEATGMLATGKEFASEEFCAHSGCHSMDEVVAGTWGFEGNDEKYNPHSSHQDYALECGDCHKVHEKSTLVCNECHALTAPEGWEAPNE